MRSLLQTIKCTGKVFFDGKKIVAGIFILKQVCVASQCLFKQTGYGR